MKKYEKLEDFREVTRKHLSHWNMDGMDELCYFGAYVETFGENAMNDLIEYASNSEAKSSEIMLVLAHDLNGVNDKYPEHFIPKSLK